MMILASILLAAAGQEIIAVPCENCNYTQAEPRDTVAFYDSEAALRIYEPYFQCHWEALSTHSEFGSTDDARAQIAMSEASESCANERVPADNQMDAFLASRSEYGDEENIVRVRERFRWQGGVLYASMTAAMIGKRDEYLAMVQAISGARAE